jgi:DEAD/DEAH box helicase domain-containing protein
MTFIVGYCLTLKELTFGLLSDRLLVKLCLLREFFLRPKRLFSLEGLGLLQLCYPGLDKANPPAVMQQRGVKPEEWRALLQIAVDYFLTKWQASDSGFA